MFCSIRQFLGLFIEKVEIFQSCWAQLNDKKIIIIQRYTVIVFWHLIREGQKE
jgi:hypothetical protein